MYQHIIIIITSATKKQSLGVLHKCLLTKASKFLFNIIYNQRLFAVNM